MHAHLDPVGGIAGDMFAAALLDALPHCEAPMLEALAAAGVLGLAAIERHDARDAVLTGSRVAVTPVGEASGHGHHHHHRHWAEIRAWIEALALPAGVRARAVDIFALLAAAEGRIHGVDPEAVAFHEVGAWDSIADVLMAAWLAEETGIDTWGVSSVPMGQGRIEGAHGTLPVPAPATALLLEGYDLYTDAHRGERVTPTGAAILRHLAPPGTGSIGGGRLRAQGTGFGTRTFAGMSNVLRVLVFDTAGDAPVRDEVVVCEFEVDDQTPEDLAVGLDRLREVDGVLDVTQAPVYGKKGRMAHRVQVLAAPPALEAALDACFTETTTLGVRFRRTGRAVLAREVRVDRESGRAVRVKRAHRPRSVVTEKADIDDLREFDGGHHARQQARRATERNEDE